MLRKKVEAVLGPLTAIEKSISPWVPLWRGFCIHCHRYISNIQDKIIMNTYLKDCDYAIWDEVNSRIKFCDQSDIDWDVGFGLSFRLGLLGVASVILLKLWLRVS